MIRASIRHMQRYCKYLKLPVLRLHDLRAVYLTTLARSGLRLDQVQMVAGHSNISTTARYYIAKDISEICQAMQNFASGSSA